MPGSLPHDVEAAGKSNRIPALRVSVYLAREIRKLCLMTDLHNMSQEENCRHFDTYTACTSQSGYTAMSQATNYQLLQHKGLAQLSNTPSRHSLLWGCFSIFVFFQLMAVTQLSCLVRVLFNTTALFFYIFYCSVSVGLIWSLHHQSR